MAAIIEKVYKGASNDNAVTITHSGTGTPLSGVTRLTMLLEPANITLDTDVSAELSHDSVDKISFDLGAVAANGYQSATIKAYDPTHPSGQTLAHPSGNILQFQFID